MSEYFEERQKKVAAQCAALARHNKKVERELRAADVRYWEHNGAVLLEREQEDEDTSSIYCEWFTREYIRNEADGEADSN